MDAKTESRAVTLTVGGKQRVYDIDLPDLPATPALVMFAAGRLAGVLSAPAPGADRRG